MHFQRCCKRVLGALRYAAEMTRFFDDRGRSFGMIRMPLTPHNIEIQHLDISTSELFVLMSDVIGLLVNVDGRLDYCGVQ